MKKFFITCIMLSLFFITKAQTVEVPAAIKPYLEAGMKGTSSAFKNLNLDSLLHYTHPGVFKIASKEQLKEGLESFMQQLSKDDIEILELSGPFQLVQIGNEYQGVFKQHLKMKIMGETFESTTWLLGQSFTNGTSWRFFDYKQSKEMALMIMPDLSDKINLPVE